MEHVITCYFKSRLFDGLTDLKSLLKSLCQACGYSELDFHARIYQNRSKSPTACIPNSGTAILEDVLAAASTPHRIRTVPPDHVDGSSSYHTVSLSNFVTQPGPGTSVLIHHANLTSLSLAISDCAARVTEQEPAPVFNDFEFRKQVLSLVNWLKDRLPEVLAPEKLLPGGLTSDVVLELFACAYEEIAQKEKSGEKSDIYCTNL